MLWKNTDTTFTDIQQQPKDKTACICLALYLEVANVLEAKGVLILMALRILSFIALTYVWYTAMHFLARDEA